MKRLVINRIRANDSPQRYISNWIENFTDRMIGMYILIKHRKSDLYEIGKLCNNYEYKSVARSHHMLNSDDDDCLRVFWANRDYFLLTNDEAKNIMICMKL